MSIGSLSNSSNAHLPIGSSPPGGFLRQARQPIKVGPGQEGTPATQSPPQTQPIRSTETVRLPSTPVKAPSPDGATTSPVHPDTGGADIRAGGILYEVA